MSVQAAAATANADSVARLCAAVDDARLRAALGRLDWVARLPNGAAPGFVYLAGAYAGWPVGGGGRSLEEAAAKLAGEAAEAVAMTAPVEPCRTPADPAIAARWVGGDHGGPMVAAENLTRGGTTAVPAAAFAHAVPSGRRAGAPPASLGVAAGPSRDAAALAGLLELIERDAAAAWWRDGASPRMVDAGIAAEAAGELARLRAGAASARATAFYDLDSATGVPVACAVSREADGRGLAVGLKAAPDPPAALHGAMLELLQMEIALDLARLRLARDSATEADRGPLGRAGLDPERFAAFAALPPAVRTAPAPADLGGLVAQLAALGHEVTVADLPALQDGPAVVKVFVPGLRPMPGGDVAPGPDAPGAHAALM